MSKMKLVVTLIIFGFLGLQYNFIAQAQESLKDQMKNNQNK